MNFSPWLYKCRTQYETNAHLWLHSISRCIYQTEAGINKCYLKKVKQVWSLELQPRWGAWEMRGKQRGGGLLFLEQFLKHSKLPPKYFPLALKSEIICLTDRIRSPSKQQIGEGKKWMKWKFIGQIWVIWHTHGSVLQLLSEHTNQANLDSLRHTHMCILTHIHTHFL